MTIRYFSNFSSLAYWHCFWHTSWFWHAVCYPHVSVLSSVSINVSPCTNEAYVLETERSQLRDRGISWVLHQTTVCKPLRSGLALDRQKSYTRSTHGQVHNLTEAQLLLHKQVYEPQTHLLRIAASFLAIWCSFSFPLSVSLLSRNTHHKHKHEHTNTQAHKRTWWSANPSTRIRTISSSTNAQIAQMKVLSVKMVLARVEMELHPQHQIVHHFK
jgi:hypothetical protein